MPLRRVLPLLILLLLALPLVPLSAMGPLFAGMALQSRNLLNSAVRADASSIGQIPPETLVRVEGEVRSGGVVVDPELVDISFDALDVERVVAMRAWNHRCASRDKQGCHRWKHTLIWTRDPDRANHGSYTNPPKALTEREMVQTRATIGGVPIAYHLAQRKGALPVRLQIAASAIQAVQGQRVFDGRCIPAEWLVGTGTCIERTGGRADGVGDLRIEYWAHPDGLPGIAYGAWDGEQIVPYQLWFGSFLQVYLRMDQADIEAEQQRDLVVVGCMLAGPLLVAIGVGVSWVRDRRGPAHGSGK